MNSNRKTRLLITRGCRVAALLWTTLALAGCGKSPTSSDVNGGRGPGPQTPTSHATASFNTSVDTGDVPFAVSYTNLSSNASSQVWDFGDGTTSTAVNPVHIFTSFGRHVVTLTVTGSDGVAVTASRTVTANRIVTPFSGNVPSPRQGAFWPSHTQGDCEFAGHGPNVWLDAVLHTASNRSQLVLSLHMKAQETASDWTTAEGSWDDVLWTAPANAAISGLLEETELHVSGVCSGTAYLRSPVNTLGSFWFLGDTDGNDVCGTTTGDTNTSFDLNRSYRIRLTPR